MLHAGLENEPRALMKAIKRSLWISIGGIVLPLVTVFGVMKLFGYSNLESVFVGMVLSITAIAIAARILKDTKISRTKAGQIAMGAAILTDIFALVMFSVLLDVINTGGVEIASLVITIAKIAGFFGIVMFLGFKLQRHFASWFRSKGFTLTLIVALGLGLLAEWIGLHIIIGAFLAGLFIREEVLDAATYNKIEDRIYGLSYSFLGPIFIATLALDLDFKAAFAATGVLVALIVTRIVTKVLGAWIPAYLQKMPPKQALIIGLAMNTKGAVDLVIISIGFKQGIIDATIFSILITVTFASTIFTMICLKPLARHAQ